MRKGSGAIGLIASVALAVALAPSLATVAHEGTGGNDVIHACVNNGVLKIAPSNSGAD